MKNKKKAPRKYAMGGNVQQIKDARTIDTIAPVNKGKKERTLIDVIDHKKRADEATYGEGLKDRAKGSLQTAASLAGLNNAPMFGADKYTTEEGKKGANDINKYIAPVSRAVVGAGITAVGGPVAGQAYMAGTMAVDQSQQKKYNKKNAQLDTESDIQYQNRMAKIGIDSGDTRTGLQGTEGLMAAGLSAGYGLATDPKTAKGIEGIKGLVKKKKPTSSDLAVQQQEQDLNAQTAGVTLEDPNNIYGSRQGFKKGGVLKGKTHKEGGIKGMVGKTPIEMENNEIVLTKGVYENPELREAASRINQMAGGNPIKGVGKGLSKLGEGDVTQEAIIKARKKNTGEKAKKDLENNIESSKKDVELYTKKGLTDRAKQAQKELNNFNAQYNKQYPKPKVATTTSTPQVNSPYAPKSKEEINASNAKSFNDKVAALKKKETTTTSSGIAKVKPTTTKPTVSAPVNKEESEADYNAQWKKSMQEGLAFNNEKAKTAETQKEKSLTNYNKDYAAAVAQGEAYNKNKEAQVPAIDKQTFALETGLGLFQTGMGLQQLRKDGKRPAYQVPSELTNSLARANEDAKIGFDAATGQAYKNTIEQARIQNVALASQLGGGNAASVQNNARAATNQLGAGMLNFYSKDAQLQLQKKQYADQLGKAVASEKDRGFQYKMDAFNQNQKAGADLLGAGISNIFTMRKNQRELDAQAKFGQTTQFSKDSYNKWAVENNKPII